MRLVACYITEKDCDLLELSIKSIIDHVDKIYVIYSRTDGDNTQNMILEKFPLNKIITSVDPYPHNEKGANGMQRNKYLEMVKHYEQEECFVIVLDSDEVVDNAEALRKFAQDENNKEKLFNVHMRHLIGDFQHEDSTTPQHYCPHRLFHWKPGDKLAYPEKEHPILMDINGEKGEGVCDAITIWHLAYARHVVGLHKKYKNHQKKSTIHSPAFLYSWYTSHVFGAFPRARFDPSQLPDVLIDHFELRDVISVNYFQNRKLEGKHFIDARMWLDQFKPDSVLMVGDGLGHRSFALATYGADVEAFDINQWAVDHCPYAMLKGKLKEGNILDYVPEKKHDLVVAYDILEHLEPEDLDIALQNLFDWTSKAVLISVPVIGDPNLEADPTHKSKFTKDEWKKKIADAGFEVQDAPNHFLYRDQLIVGVKNDA